MISVNNVTKCYGKTTALEGVSVVFEDGKIYGLLGRNGAGKSTLLKIMTNRAFTTSGNIEINGESATENPNMKKHIYFMTEENFFGTQKVKEILKLTADVFPGFDTNRAERYINLFKLDDKKKFSALSTGYKNIFKLILALCQNQPYIIFDEPVVGLDAYHRELFYKLLLECYAEGERTIILATHLIEEVQNIVEDVVIIDSGKIIATDSVENLLQSGYSIAGRPEVIDDYIKGRNVIDTEEISGMKIAYLLDKPNTEGLPESVTISPLNLQKLFVRLTGGNEDD